jgi:hypothetical protein
MITFICAFLLALYLVIGIYMIAAIHLAVIRQRDSGVRSGNLSTDVLVTKCKENPFEYYISMFISIFIWLPLMVIYQ